MRCFKIRVSSLAHASASTATCLNAPCIHTKPRISSSRLLIAGACSIPWMKQCAANCVLLYNKGSSSSSGTAYCMCLLQSPVLKYTLLTQQALCARSYDRDWQQDWGYRHQAQGCRGATLGSQQGCNGITLGLQASGNRVTEGRAE